MEKGCVLPLPGPQGLRRHLIGGPPQVVVLRYPTLDPLRSPLDVPDQPLCVRGEEPAFLDDDLPVYDHGLDVAPLGAVDQVPYGVARAGAFPKLRAPEIVKMS